MSLPPGQLLSIRVSSGFLRKTISSGKIYSFFHRFDPRIRTVDFLHARLCLIDAFFRRPVFRCRTLSFFRSVSVLCATLYILSRFLQKIFQILLSLTSTDTRFCCFFLSPSLSLSLSHQHSRSIFILPLHALFRLPSFTRFTPDLPPSRSHIASSLQLSRIPLCFSNHHLSLSFFLSSQPPRVSLFNIILRAMSSSFNPCSLSSSIILPKLCPSLTLYSYLPPTHTHPPPSSSAGSVRIGPAR